MSFREYWRKQAFVHISDKEELKRMLESIDWIIEKRKERKKNAK